MIKGTTAIRLLLQQREKKETVRQMTELEYTLHEVDYAWSMYAWCHSLHKKNRINIIICKLNKVNEINLQQNTHKIIYNICNAIKTTSLPLYSPLF